MDRNQYLEEIKRKLDALNKAAGFNPNQHGNLKSWDNYNSSDDIFGAIGAAGKAYIEKNQNPPGEMPQLQTPNTGLIFF